MSALSSDTQRVCPPLSNQLWSLDRVRTGREGRRHVFNVSIPQSVKEWRQLVTHLLPDVVPGWGEWQEALPVLGLEKRLLCYYTSSDRFLGWIPLYKWEASRSFIVVISRDLWSWITHVWRLFSRENITKEHSFVGFHKRWQNHAVEEKKSSTFSVVVKACLQIRFPKSVEWLLFRFSFVLGI